MAKYRIMHQLIAMTKLHLVRAVRYKYGLINWGLIEFLYMAIYILGALAFTTPDQWAQVSQYMFWGILAWSLVSTPTWTIGGWTRFYINMGLWEQHELANSSHTLFLSLRIIPALITGIVGSLAAYGFIAITIGSTITIQGSIIISLVALIWLILQATLYGLFLSYLSIITSTPGPMLDVLNLLLFVVGGIGIPVSALPREAVPIAVATPYSHPAELLRWSTIGVDPYLGVHGEIIAGIVTTLGLLALAAITGVKAYKRARTLGVKGIGRM